MDKSTTPNSSKKRGSYSTYSPRDRAIIGNYAAEHGPAAAMRKFKADYPELKESTTRYFRDSYKRELTNRKRKLDFDCSEECQITEIQTKKRGRKTPREHSNNACSWYGHCNV